MDLHFLYFLIFSSKKCLHTTILLYLCVIVHAYVHLFILFLLTIEVEQTNVRACIHKDSKYELRELLI